MGRTDTENNGKTNLRVLSLNWGHGAYSISKITRDIEKVLTDEGVEFLHVYESGAKLSGNYIRLSGWVMSRVYYVWAHFSGRQYGTGYLPYLKWRRIVVKYAPDVVHIHCPNGFTINLYKVLEYLKKTKIPTVITNHAEFFYTGNCSYADECSGFITGCKKCYRFKEKTYSLFFNRTEWAWGKMKSAFEGFEHLKMVLVSPWALTRMKLSPICNQLPAVVIGNGVDTQVFRYFDVTNKNIFRKVVLHVTADFSDNENKGGKYVLDLARCCEDEEIDFIVIGKCNLDEPNIPRNMTLLGTIQDQRQLAEYYNAADVTLISSRRETFGMVCVESLCCGTPVVGFKNGGTESIAIPDYTLFAEFGDVEALKSVLMTMLNTEYDKAAISEQACSLYSKERMARSYLNVYREVAGEI